jgi:uncharacterized protein YjbI with pentapeptide repeats
MSDGATKSTTSGSNHMCPLSMPLSGVDRCGRSCVAGEALCFWHLPSKDKFKTEMIEAYFGPGVTLAHAIEEEVKAGRALDWAFLPGMNGGGSLVQKGPDLSSGRFAGADLRGASLSYSNLRGAVFAGANLSRAKLSNCDLSGVNFYKTRLFRAKFRDNDLSSVLRLRRSNFRGFSNKRLPAYGISEEYPDQAEPMYLELVKYFSSRGLLDDASWAAYRAGVLRHRMLRARVSLAKIRSERVVFQILPNQFFEEPAGTFVEWTFAAVAWLQSLFSLMVIGYGEKPFRPLLCAGLTIVAFAGVYALPGGPGHADFSTSLYFSIVTFTTLGYGDLVPHGAYRLVAGCEALSGIFLVGLFLFCLGRRSVSRS